MSTSRKRSKAATQSALNREKRRKELEQLQHDNERLMHEQHRLQLQIERLEREVQNDLGEATVEDLQENAVLKQQVKEHRRFIDKFREMFNAAPSSTSGRRALFEDGADCAHSFVQCLIAKSMDSSWRSVDLGHMVDDTVREMSLKIQTNTTTANKQKHIVFSDVDTFNEQGRTNVRSDMLFNNKHDMFSSDKLGQFWMDLFTSDEMQRKLFDVHNDGVKVTKLEDDTPEDTAVVHHRLRLPDDEDAQHKDVVFIVNKKRVEMAKSTIMLPGNDRSSGGKDIECFGRMDGYAVSSMSTSVRRVEANEANRIKSLVVQGVVVWDEQLKSIDGPMGKCTRMVLVQSFPKSFALGSRRFTHDRLEAIFEPRQNGVNEFGRYMKEIVANFKKVMEQGAPETGS